jgi:ABC-type cobalamin/Fe3+-siderophores transport system ATPase subunit
MKNIDVKVKGNQLTITVDLSKEFGPSASGKTIIIASTEGNQKIEGTVAVLGMNVYRKPTEAKA